MQVGGSGVGCGRWHLCAVIRWAVGGEGSDSDWAEKRRVVPIWSMGVPACRVRS